LSDALKLIRQVLIQQLDVAQDAYCAVDSLPLAVVQFYHAPLPMLTGAAMRHRSAMFHPKNWG